MSGTNQYIEEGKPVRKLPWISGPAVMMRRLALPLPGLPHVLSCPT
jgi:hypothetical protein